MRNLNFKSIPNKVYLNGEIYQGDAVFINGFNGYTKTETDSLLSAVINNSAFFNGKANLLTDSEGNYLHSENRRGQELVI